MMSHTMASTMDGVAVRTQRAMDVAQDAAERAGEYVRRQVVDISDRVRDLAGAARERVHGYTGPSVELWASDARAYVREHPLQMLGVIVGVGYILGKLITLRGDEDRSARSARR